MTDQRPILTLKRPQPRPRVVGSPRAQPRQRTGATRPQQRRADAGRAECEFLTVLQNLTPAVWDPAAPAPLAEGVHRQLNPVADANGISRRAVRRFLAGWTSAPAYLRALIQPEARRFNIDGSDAGPVSERHRAQAEKRVQRHEAEQS